MKAIICDKCGKEIRIHPELAASFPWVSLTIREEGLDKWKEIDLCMRCRMKLIRWVRNEKGDNDVDVT